MSNSCINVWVDEIVPCLKDTSTGEIKETVVFRIETKSYLDKFCESNGWCINWSELPKEVEICVIAKRKY